MKFLGKTIFTAGIASIEDRIRISSKNKNFKPVNIYTQYILRLAEKLLPLLLLLREDVHFTLTQQHFVIFHLNQCLLKASKRLLKILLLEKQLVEMCDLCEIAAGYVLLIEGYTDEETGETNKFPPVAYGSKGLPQCKCHK